MVVRTPVSRKHYEKLRACSNRAIASAWGHRRSGEIGGRLADVRVPEPVPYCMQRHAAFEPSASGFPSKVMEVEVDLSKRCAARGREVRVGGKRGNVAVGLEDGRRPRPLKPQDPRADVRPKHVGVGRLRVAGGIGSRISRIPLSRVEIGIRRSVVVFVFACGRKIDAPQRPLFFDVNPLQKTLKSL